MICTYPEESVGGVKDGEANYCNSGFGSKTFFNLIKYVSTI